MLYVAGRTFFPRFSLFAWRYTVVLSVFIFFFPFVFFYLSFISCVHNKRGIEKLAPFEVLAVYISSFSKQITRSNAALFCSLDLSYLFGLRAHSLVLHNAIRPLYFISISVLHSQIPSIFFFVFFFIFIIQYILYITFLLFSVLVYLSGFGMYGGADTGCKHLRINFFFTKYYHSSKIMSSKANKNSYLHYHVYIKIGSFRIAPRRIYHKSANNVIYD